VLGQLADGDERRQRRRVDQQAVIDEIKGIYGGREGVSLDELDGLTVSGADPDGARWWFNVRPSNTEPLLRLNAEAADEARMAALRDTVLTIIRGGAS
jgi:phosphomannomutase